MRLPAEKIKEAILHADQDVRTAAVYYFGGSCSSDPSIIPLAIQAFERHGLDAFEAYTFLENLVQPDDTVGWLIQEIERIGPASNERDFCYAKALAAALRSADAALLQRHEPSIEDMRYLDQTSKSVIRDRIFLTTFTPDALWRELMAFCEEQDREEFDFEQDVDYGRSIVCALARYSDEFVGQVLDILEVEHGTNWLETMTVRLAGEMRLQAAIGHLVDRLEDPGTGICEEAHRALARIGTDAVVIEIAARYPDSEWDFRLAAASMLEDIHTDLSVQTCLDLLGQEEDEAIRGSLLQSVLMNFSPDGIEAARQFILGTTKSPDLLEVRSALLVVCKLMGKTFPELDAWREDAKSDVEFRRQWYVDHPLEFDEDDFDADEIMDDIDDDFDSEETDLDEDFDEEPAPPSVTFVRRKAPVGRNDPCPCGSGKKYKKCCYGKENALDETDVGHSSAMSDVQAGMSPPSFPLGTVALYGPNDKVTTKIVAGVIKREGVEAIIERWVGTNIKDSPKVQRQINEFFQRHGVKSVVATEGNMGCPHEEGLDFPTGQDCPFCPFWAGKQGSARRE